MAIDDPIRQNEYNPLIITTSVRKDLEIESIENLVHLKVDGIILVATEVTPRHKEIIKQINIPLVVFF